MAIPELDLGQVNTYETREITQASIVKHIGIIINNESKLDTPITLMNRPQNNFFNFRKTGNTLEYILILSFEKIV